MGKLCKTVKIRNVLGNKFFELRKADQFCMISVITLFRHPETEHFYLPNSHEEHFDNISADNIVFTTVGKFFFARQKFEKI